MAFELKITGQMLKRAGLALLGAAVVAGLVFLGLFLFGKEDPLAAFVDDGAIQAVFLEDGSAYFGRVEGLRGDFYELADVYVVKQTPGKEEDDPPTPSVQPRSGEIHGPQGRMLIPRDAVLVIENLREDSELAKTIAEAQARR